MLKSIVKGNPVLSLKNGILASKLQKSEIFLTFATIAALYGIILFYNEFLAKHSTVII